MLEEFLKSELAKELFTYGGWAAFGASEMAGAVKRKGLLFVLAAAFNSLGQALLNFKRVTSEKQCDPANEAAFDEAFGKQKPKEPSE